MTTALSRPSPPLKWHGGKHYLAKKIVAMMPRHTHYVELFAGGLQVLFAKDFEGVSEVVNDLNRDLTNFYDVLADPERFKAFSRRVEATPFGRPQWEDAAGRLADPDPAVRAVAFFVHCRMSYAGRLERFTGVTKARTRRGRNGEVSAWASAVEGLPAVHARLAGRVLVECEPAVRLMAGHDEPGVLMYADPPYPAGTRTSPAVYGEFEMNESDHREFLAAARGLRHARLLISGYPGDLYDAELAGWSRHAFEVPNNAAGGKQKRRMTEVIWANF